MVYFPYAFLPSAVRCYAMYANYASVKWRKLLRDAFIGLTIKNQSICPLKMYRDRGIEAANPL